MSKDRQAIAAPEEGSVLQLDFTKMATNFARGLNVIPVAVQDIDTREVILTYTNEVALQHSIRTRIATFGVPRNELWVKGQQSGNTFELVEIRVNCRTELHSCILSNRRPAVFATQKRTWAGAQLLLPSSQLGKWRS